MRMIFVNLPVRDLDVSKAFWTELGFRFEEAYTDDSAACLVLEDNAFAMLLTEAWFRDFITTEIADASATKEVLTCLSVEQRQEVDDLVARAVAAGGKAWLPAFEHGPMYGGSFQDPDGHVWELMQVAQGADGRPA